MSADRVNPEIDLAQMGADGMSADRVTPEVNLARGDDDFVKDNGGDDLVLTGEEDEGIVISDLDLSQTEEGDDRITSYNVCYTKLLRVAFCEKSHQQRLDQQFLSIQLLT